MGLNDTYAQARGNILMINPLLDINLAYSLILKDDNQREIYMSPVVPSDSSSFMVGKLNISRGGKQTQRFAPQGTGSTHSRLIHHQQLQRFPRQNQKFKRKKAKYNPNVSCTHCGKTCHVEYDCYTY